MLAELKRSLKSSSGTERADQRAWPVRNVPNELLSHIFILSCDYPLRTFYRRKLPHQATISHVCSRWRRVALSTGALWSNIKFTEFYSENVPRRLGLYRTWVRRAGNYPLTITLYLIGQYHDFDKVLLDFVVPFRIKTLNLTLPYHKLLKLPHLEVEEFVVTITDIQADGDLELPHFVDRVRGVSFWELAATLPAYEAKLKGLCLPWHQLRSLECRSHILSLSTWLDILHQSQALRSLESCHLTISSTGSGPLVGVCMPDLRWFTMTLLDVQPDIVIPLIQVPNLAGFGVVSRHNWSSDTWGIIKRHYELRQQQWILLHPALFPIRIAQVLTDAPMIHNLEVHGRPVLDAKDQADIACGGLGRCLTSLNLGGCFDSAGEWLDMIETRQGNVHSTIEQASNWREMFTGIKWVRFSEVSKRFEYEERVASLRELGIGVSLLSSQWVVI